MGITEAIHESSVLESNLQTAVFEYLLQSLSLHAFRYRNARYTQYCWRNVDNTGILCCSVLLDFDRSNHHDHRTFHVYRLGLSASMPVPILHTGLYRHGSCASCSRNALLHPACFLLSTRQLLLPHQGIWGQNLPARRRLLSLGHNRGYLLSRFICGIILQMNPFLAWVARLYCCF